MKKIYIFIGVSIAVVISSLPLVFLVPNIVAAAYVPCVDLSSNLYIGSTDALTAGQVSALQSFLIAKGYLTVVYVPTGYFGTATLQAVRAYEYSQGIVTNGYVSEVVRAAIRGETCNAGYSSYSGGYITNYPYTNTNTNYYYNNYYAIPAVTSLSPYAGAVGTSVTVYGSGFDYSNNTVNFGGTTLSGLASNGTSITFTVPQIYNQNYSSGYYYQNGSNNVIGNYNVSVTTSHGTSNALSFTLTYGNDNCYNNNYNYSGGYSNCYSNSVSPISLSNVNGPSTLTTGTAGTWSVNLYNPNSNFVTVAVKWGDEGTYGYGYNISQNSKIISVSGQQTVTFAHTYTVSGTYTVVFSATDSQGTQTNVSTTVNVTNSSYGYQNQIYLNSISPNMARAGTQVTLYGSGFSSYGNAVHFGSGGTMNLSSINNGSTIYFTIPFSVGPCDITTGYNTVCPMYAQYISAGSYPVYVTNSYGQSSNTVYFTVSQY